MGSKTEDDYNQLEENLSKSPRKSIEHNGGTIIAVKFKNGVAVGFDKPFVEKHLSLEAAHPKFFELSGRTMLVTTARWEDSLKMFNSICMQRTSFSYEKGRQPTSKDIDDFVTKTIQEKKVIIPSFIVNTHVGVDEEDNGYIHVFDDLGKSIVEHYKVLGSGSIVFLPILKNLLEKDGLGLKENLDDFSEEQAKALIKETFQKAVEDHLTDNRMITMKAITPEGIQSSAYHNL